MDGSQQTTYQPKSYKSDDAASSPTTAQGLSVLFLWFLNIRYALPPLPEASAVPANTNMAETVDKVAPEPIKLDAPKDTPFTVEELAKYDGTGDCGIYVAIKGTIFDGEWAEKGAERRETADMRLSLDSLSEEGHVRSWMRLPREESLTRCYLAS